MAMIVMTVGVASAGTRPAPRPALLDRIRKGVDLIGIVHWGVNTYTDRGWGLGDEDPALLDPSGFDADQIVRAARDGGLQGLVVVAKHHDGLCLWPTKTTEHNITKTPFRGGRGDYVREMSEACRRHGLEFGVYCSPWDRNNADYGTPKYVETFHAQIRELLDGRYGNVFEMWFDNANGGDGYYGGAREKRTIPVGYYRFDEVFRFVREMQPSVCIFNEDDGADYRWPGNERGVLSNDCRATSAHFDISRYADYMAWTGRGVTDGVCFHPPEADFPLRNEWFYHASEDGTAKRPAYLMQRYLNTVGNGGTMNVGLAPNKAGVLCEEDVEALRGFGEMRRRFFSNPVRRGPCNVVEMREDVANGERVDGWILTAKGREVLRGRSIGIRRIRILPRPEAAEDLRLETDGEGAKVLPLSFYSVDADLLREIESATTASGETETAKKMNAGRASTAADPADFWNAQELFRTPRFRANPYPESDYPGMRAMLVEGRGPDGTNAEFFAYFAKPEGAMPKDGFPGLLLVHGGGGTAFPTYVAEFVKDGFAVLALDWYNQRPAPALTNVPPREGTTPRVPLAGGKRQNHVANVANMVLAHSLLRSLPEVDASRTVYVGLSWGSWYGSCVTAVDNRFKGACMIYLCDRHPDATADPNSGKFVRGPFHKSMKVPSWWIVWPRDSNGLPSTMQAGWEACPCEAGRTIVHNLGHSHAGFSVAAVHRMARFFAGEDVRVPRLSLGRRDGRTVSAEIVDAGKGVTEALLWYTERPPLGISELTKNAKTEWRSAPAKIEGTTVSATLPEGARIAYLSVYEARQPDSRRRVFNGSSGFFHIENSVGAAP